MILKYAINNIIIMLDEKKTPGKGTSTSSFGVSKRENHDSSKFYDSKLYRDLPKLLDKVNYIDNSDKIPKKALDHIIQGDSRKMDLLPDNSVDLMITSPRF